MNMIRVIAAWLQLFVGRTASIRWARATGELPTGPSLWHTIAGLLVFSWLTVASAAPGVTVVGIQVDGATAVAINDFTLRRTAGGDLVRQTLTLQNNLDSGVEIIVPARTVITLKSSNGNTITLQPGSRFTVRHVGEDGESYTLDDGGVSFDVVKALNFFNVNYRKFLAIVKGTKFSVEVEPEKEIRFAVTEGTVVVEREERILIAAPGKESTTSELTVHDVLQAGKRDAVTYRLDLDAYLRKFNTYEGAEEFFRIQLEQDELSGDTARIVDSLLNLGFVLRVQGKRELAIQLLERTRVLAGYATRPQIESLRDLASIYTDKREPERARDHLQLALTSFRAAGSALPTISLARIQIAMGYTYLEPGDYEQAIIWYERALETIGLGQSREEILEASIAHSYVASANFFAGRNSIALERGRKALLMAESLFENQHRLHLVNLYQLMSKVYISIGNYRDACTQAEKALQQTKRLFPDDRHLRTAQAYFPLAECKIELNEFDSAAYALQRSRLILEAIDPRQGTGLWRSWHFRFRELELRRGNDTLAIDHAVRALEFSAAFDKDVPSLETAIMHSKLGEVYLRVGDYVGAGRSFEDSLAILKKFFPNDLLAALTLRLAARALLALNQPVQALDYYRQAIARRERQQETRVHRLIAALQLEAADAARMAQGWQAAIPYFEASLNTFTRLQPDKPGDEVALLQARLFPAWTALGDQQKANQYAREAQATRDHLDAQARAATSKEP